MNIETQKQNMERLAAGTRDMWRKLFNTVPRIDFEDNENASGFTVPCMLVDGTFMVLPIENYGKTGIGGKVYPRVLYTIEMDMDGMDTGNPEDAPPDPMELATVQYGAVITTLATERAKLWAENLMETLPLDDEVPAADPMQPDDAANASTERVTVKVPTDTQCTFCVNPIRKGDTAVWVKTGQTAEPGLYHTFCPVIPRKVHV